MGFSRPPDLGPPPCDGIFSGLTFNIEHQSALPAMRMMEFIKRNGGHLHPDPRNERVTHILVHLTTEPYTFVDLTGYKPSKPFSDRTRSDHWDQMDLIYEFARRMDHERGPKKGKTVLRSEWLDLCVKAGKRRLNDNYEGMEVLVSLGTPSVPGEAILPAPRQLSDMPPPSRPDFPSPANSSMPPFLPAQPRSFGGPPPRPASPRPASPFDSGHPGPSSRPASESGRAPLKLRRHTATTQLEPRPSPPPTRAGYPLQRQSPHPHRDLYPGDRIHRPSELRPSSPPPRLRMDDPHSSYDQSRDPRRRPIPPPPPDPRYRSSPIRQPLQSQSSSRLNGGRDLRHDPHAAPGDHGGSGHGAPRAPRGPEHARYDQSNSPRYSVESYAPPIPFDDPERLAGPASSSSRWARGAPPSNGDRAWQVGRSLLPPAEVGLSQRLALPPLSAGSSSSNMPPASFDPRRQESSGPSPAQAPHRHLNTSIPTGPRLSSSSRTAPPPQDIPPTRGLDERVGLTSSAEVNGDRRSGTAGDEDEAARDVKPSVGQMADEDQGGEERERRQDRLAPAHLISDSRTVPQVNLDNAKKGPTPPPSVAPAKRSNVVVGLSAAPTFSSAGKRRKMSTGAKGDREESEAWSLASNASSSRNKYPTPTVDSRYPSPAVTPTISSRKAAPPAVASAAPGPSTSKLFTTAWGPPVPFHVVSDPAGTSFALEFVIEQCGGCLVDITAAILVVFVLPPGPTLATTITSLLDPESVESCLKKVLISGRYIGDCKAQGMMLSVEEYKIELVAPSLADVEQEDREREETRATRQGLGTPESIAEAQVKDESRPKIGAKDKAMAREQPASEPFLSESDAEEELEESDFDLDAAGSDGDTADEGSEDDQPLASRWGPRRREVEAPRKKGGRSKRARELETVLQEDKADYAWLKKKFQAWDLKGPRGAFLERMDRENTKRTWYSFYKKYRSRYEEEVPKLLEKARPAARLVRK